MASIKKRPNGSWRARYRDEDGREHARHFARKIDAQQWLDTVTASVVRGDYVDPNAGRVTFREFYRSWSALQIWESGTREGMDLVPKQAPFADTELRRIRRSHVEAWVQEMVQRGFAPQTVHTRVGNARTVFKAALDDQVIARDPSQGVRLPQRRAREHAMELPSAEDVRAILGASEPWFRVAIGLGAFAGLRIGEVNGLQLGDVDFLRRSIHVRRQVQRRPPLPIEVRAPKYNSERVIYAPDGLLTMLSEHLSEFGTYGDDRWLLPGRDGGPAWPRSLDYYWTKAREAAGLSTRFHGLRHFYASGLIAAGCDVVTVQRSLGHKSPSVTLNVYSHLWSTAEDRTRQAAQGLVEGVLVPVADSVRTPGAASAFD